jgi:hypothetical protein
LAFGFNRGLWLSELFIVSIFSYQLLELTLEGGTDSVSKRRFRQPS